MGWKRNREERREGYKDLEELKNTDERNVLTWTEEKVGERNDKMDKKKGLQRNKKRQEEVRERCKRDYGNQGKKKLFRPSFLMGH
jgi:hypothetical protein